MKDIFFKLMFNIPFNLPFSPERIKTEKVEKLVDNLHDKREYSYKKFKASIKSWISFEKYA